MFRAASRHASARAQKLVPAQRQAWTRSIYSNNGRPTLRPRYNITNVDLFTIPHTRHLTVAQKIRMKYREASKGVFRKNPVLLPLAIFSVVGGIAVFAYVSYVEVTRVQPQYHKFPPQVADQLRTAVYYTEIDLNPPKALKAYKEALRTAVEMGMHPFSDEVLGIKLQVAMMLEKSGLVKPAVEVLERTKTEALKWIEEGRKAESGLADKSKAGRVPVKANVSPENGQTNEDSAEDAEKQLKEMQEFEAKQRDRTLKKVVGIEMKLAELYSSEYIQDEKKAEDAQVAAVELCLKEMHRRQSLGLPVGGGAAGEGDSEAWLNMTEIATALVELADTYTTKDRSELAMPLYLRALEMIRAAEGDSPSCKQVVLLNSVASAMFGQAQIPAKPRSQEKQTVSREQTIDAARQWAQKAIDVAARIQPPVRNEECDMTCVAATYNLGEIAELQNKPDVAQQRYAEAKSLAQGLGYEEGVAMADEALKRLQK
ncbi:TPR domain protein [Penicillium brasilianum]|uniref:TPR domain protein n=1 Tax=Penicillium brasilianum TaxID=104259 RepID=A0A1S9RNZ9_PENBI|nr:TPR domain protein [Penicillium brasilianum]